MKKIPLHTAIFFYLSIVPVVGFLLLCVFYGDIDEIVVTIIWIIWSYGSTLIFLLPVIIGLQITAIVNYVDARRQVNSYNCQIYNENKIPLLTVKFFYFSTVITLIFVIFCTDILPYGIPSSLIILSPFIIILQVSGIVAYVDALENKILIQISNHSMKKFPLYTIILFYLLLIPSVFFLIKWGVHIYYGDHDKIFETSIMIMDSVLVISGYSVISLQTAGIVNYINAYREVREYKEDHADDEDYQNISDNDDY